MKLIILLFPLLLLTCQGKCQGVPKPADPCMKLDTDDIKDLIIGTWVEIADTAHVIIITPDSVEETVVIWEGNNRKTNISYWNYKFTDNIFSSDEVACYSIVEYRYGYPHKLDYAINYIDSHYILLGASGRKVYKRK